MRLRARARTRSAAPSPATPPPARPSTGSSSASHPAAVSCNVKRTISSTFAAGIDGLRPRPGRTAEKFFSPSSANRSRHAVTVVGDDPDLARDPRVREPVRGHQQRTRALHITVRRACAIESTSPAPIVAHR